MHCELLTYLCRWWQDKGFGIESKNDYAFLTDVIKETHPYYAYADIAREHPSDTPRQQRRRQLLYRVHNALKGKDYAIVEARLSDSDMWQQYLSGRYITFDMVDVGIAIQAYDRHPQHYKILRH